MIRKNIIANLVGRIWGVISVYLFVPLYLQFLGMEAYGLIGFYSTLLGVLVFADLGFTATLNREMARLSASGGSCAEMRDLLRTYESIYLFISLVLSLFLCGLAPLIAEHWLRSQLLPQDQITSALRLLGVAIGFQLPAGLFTGGLMGLQRQVRVNLQTVAFGMFRGVGAVLVLWAFSPTIVAFAFWQLICNAFYCLFVRADLWRVLSSDELQSKPRFNPELFRRTWRYAAGMAGTAALSILLTQTDKLIVSKVLPLKMLGHYTLASAVASIPLLLATPIASAVSPRLTGFVALGSREALTSLYHRTCELIGIIIIPTGITLVFFASEFILVWTGSAVAAKEAGLPASLLVAGQLMQAVTVVPYYIAVAHGNIRLNLKIGIWSVIVITPLLFFLVLRYGVVGAGISWLVMNLCTLPPYMYFLHRHFLPGELRQWFFGAVGRPLAATLACMFLARWLAPETTSRLGTLFMIALISLLAGSASLLTSGDLRQQFHKQLCRTYGSLGYFFRLT
jgi:O-antigen/teichoic acid export membrane protein